ncbi:MAG: hypothetical protein JXB62_00435 [Pirellulales bacterium]|nr:hypothetical protein [Pirellulales bacterium]
MAGKSVLPPLWNVPQEFRNRLGEQAGRQRAMHRDGHLLLVLHGPPQPEDVRRDGRFFWRAPDGAWNATVFRGGANAIRMHLEEFAERLEEYDERLEQASSAEDYFRLLQSLAPLCRSARHMHHTLQEARKTCPDDRDLIIFRDRAYEIERSAELLYDEAKNALDFAVAKRAEEQTGYSLRMALSTHRLNLLAAFFFPIATLSALFGANLKSGLEEACAPLPFVGVLCAGLLLGAVLKSFVTRGQ